MESPHGGSITRREGRIKDKYRENINRDEWREPTRLDIMTSFGKSKIDIGL